MFAHIISSMEPLADDASNTFEFVDEVVGGRIPAGFIPSVRKGLAEALAEGPLGPFEVVGVKVTLIDGGFHKTDSSDHSFRLCAAEAMRQAILPNADVVLLEPVMKLEIEVPLDCQGVVTGHVSKNRGLVTSSESADGLCTITAEVPLAELFNYATDLRSMTQGHGSFTMEFLAYRQVPAAIQKRVLKEFD